MYLCRSRGLLEIAEYWENVIKINDHQKERFAKAAIKAMFNTVKNKKVTLLGFAFKKDTGDTRETAAITIAKILADDGGNIAIYDPKGMMNIINMMSSA